MVQKAKVKEQKTISIEEKLRNLYKVQLMDSEIDKIKMVRGELPLEVQDLEDEVTGLETRIENVEKEMNEFKSQIDNKKNEIKESEALITKYKEQQNNVRNNREFESLEKEMEFQTLEIELCNKRIKEYTLEISSKDLLIASSKTKFEDRKLDLVAKKDELDEIIKENEKEIANLSKKLETLCKKIDSRTLKAYYRLRNNARNGLAVVCVERNACAGCFNMIPPQRQIDIKSRKKLIACEYCGRILVDEDILKNKEEVLAAEKAREEEAIAKKKTKKKAKAKVKVKAKE